MRKCPLHFLITTLFTYFSYLFYFFIDSISYCIFPSGASTSTVSPFFAPNSALPNGDSFDILFSAKFTSVDPTIVYSTSSSNSTSYNFTLFPICIVFVSISFSSIIFACLNLLSNSAIFISFSVCAVFASSYSEFSDKSPNPNGS